MNFSKRIFNVKLLLPVTVFFTCFTYACFKPAKNFSSYTPPLPPDYSLQKNWAALPTVKDSADVVPHGSYLKEGQANAKVDVFYIHPTMYYKRKSWNADMNDERTNKLVDKFPMRQQAGVFNESCKVYAPRYRQATLYAFMEGNGDGHRALDTAYNDIRKAFLYYLKNYNNGRPVIIAGHSQGTFLAQKLLSEFFDNDPKMKKQLVAAYLIGGNIGKGSFTTLVPCDSASQTNCYVAWHSRQFESEIEKPNEKQATAPAWEKWDQYVCVNPLTCRRDTMYAPASLNFGSVPSSFDRIDKGLIDAKISSQAIIWSHKPGVKGYPKGKNYHVVDYSLFYMNIRINVKERCEKYFAKEK